MKSTLTDKNELINFCRIIYKNNFNELNIIKEFEENYLPNQALWWYTRESFLYRLLNKALRIKNIDLLFLFRFFIRDLENELKKSQCLSSIRVYRGQLMSIDELNQLQNSIGEYISINSFFSTSLNRQKAIKFLNDYSFSNNLHKVLFEIDANGELNHLKPFANISSISFYSNEQEILFMLGSIFRLMNIKQEKNGLWIIQMILSNNNDENLKILFDNIKSEYNGIDEETNLISFGNILYKMGKYDLAEKYFHRLLSDLPNDHHDISRCYHALGILALIKDNYELSLQWHNKSLKILKSNDSRLADSYNCIGCIYQKKEDFKNALEFYNKALIIWKNSLREDYYQIADCLNNMGCVYEMEKNYSKALECHQNALSIRKKYLPKDHPDLGGSYNNIGNIYLCLEQYDFALENYKYSYEIKLKSLPSQHSSLASTLENIGLVYEQKQLFEQALTYYEKAARIFRDTFLSTHIYVIEIEKDIQRVLSILNSPKISTKL
jgi:tetratricopeptide (TPR) repeat protein